ncbi:hypothetical protein BD769DRAFT_1638669 [Suillus cothurnatus]|nr:hypothetical protein BD769DRAFT_1638669 [Suillus cothurnatus]
MPRHAASDLVSAVSHCTGRVKRHPERQPQLLWSKEELVSGNRKSIYTMPFELIKHIFKFFYPDERDHSNHPDQLLGVGSLIPCYDRSDHSAVTCFRCYNDDSCKYSYLNIPNEWVMGRDYSDTELERGPLFSDNSDATSADELSGVVAPSRSAEEEIAPVKCHTSLPAEECAPVKRRRASKRVQRERKRN